MGLTAYVMKDPETRQLVLQTAPLVLSDNGICHLRRKFGWGMNESTRSVLHEVMEQQTLSIAKVSHPPALMSAWVGMGPGPQRPIPRSPGGWPTLCCQVPAHLSVLYRTWVLCAVLTSNAWVFTELCPKSHARDLVFEKM